MDVATLLGLFCFISLIFCHETNRYVWKWHHQLYCNRCSIGTRTQTTQLPCSTRIFISIGFSKQILTLPWIFSGTCIFFKYLLVNQHSSGISPLLVGYTGTSSRVPFSIAMLVYRRVYLLNLLAGSSMLFLTVVTLMSHLDSNFGCLTDLTVNFAGKVHRQSHGLQDGNVTMNKDTSYPVCSVVFFLEVGGWRQRWWSRNPESLKYRVVCFQTFRQVGFKVLYIKGFGKWYTV